MTDTSAILSRSLQWMPANVLQKENGLYETKWWDYRLLTPEQTTQEFFVAYVKAWRARFAIREDAERAPYIKPLKCDSLDGCNQSAFAGLWRARQAADAVGAQYSIWCDAAMKYADDRLWEHLPRPNQLYSTKPMFEDDKSMMEVILDRVFHENNRTSDHPFFTVENFKGHLLQKQHLRMALGRLAESSNRIMITRIFVFEKKIVSEEMVMKVFGEKRGQYILSEARLMDTDD